MRTGPLIAFGLLLAFFLTVGIVCGPVHAQPLTHYTETFRFERGYDQPTLDSAFAVLFDGSVAADTGIRVAYDTARYEGRQDSLTFMVFVPATTISKVRNPSLMMCVFPSNRRTLQPPYICETKSVTHMVHSADTARQSPGVSVTLDSADIQQIIDALSAACGGGTGVNAVRIYVRDTTNDVMINGIWALIYNSDQVTLEGQGTTNGFGYYDFALNDGTYLGRVNTPPGYLQETAHDTIVVSGVTQDTVELFSFMPTLPPAGDDSCILIILTDVPYARAQIVLHGLAQADRTKPIRDTAGVWLDPGEVRPWPVDSNGDGIIQISLARTSATRPKAGYDISIYNDHNEVMAAFKDYQIPDSTTHTLRVGAN